MPEISVIVPVYKVEAYLRRCVESLLDQSFRDFELILVDDGSPDNCGAICDAYAEKDRRVRVIHKENGGLSSARNAGLDWAFQNSDSAWLSFVDSDDWVHPRYLELLRRTALEQDVQLSLCEFFKTAGESAVLPEGELPVIRCEGPALFASPRSATAIVACCKLYRRELFRGVRFPEGRLHEDEFVTYRLLCAAGPVALLDVPLYNYFQNAEGIMLRRYTPKRLDALDAVDGQLAFFGAPGLEQYRDYVRRRAFRQYARHIRLLAESGDRENEAAVRQRAKARLRKEKVGPLALYHSHHSLCEVLYPRTTRLLDPIKAALKRLLGMEPEA